MKQDKRWSSAGAFVGDAEPVNLDHLHGASSATAGYLRADVMEMLSGDQKSCGSPLGEASGDDVASPVA
jgi:hypothetical protein